MDVFEPVVNQAIVDMFCIKMAKGTSLYKGFLNIEDKVDISSDELCWFALDGKEPLKYGNIVRKVKTNKPILLVNITSGLFKSHFSDMLNLMGADDRDDVLAALGVATNVDKQLASRISEIYGKYVHGYAQPFDVPSCWHNRFPREVCLFQMGKNKLVTRDASSGGGYLSQRE